METEQILMVVAAVAAILFLVSLIMGYKTWKWHTMLMLFLVLCAAGTFYGMSMELLRIHQTWRDPYNKLQVELATTQENVVALEKGIFDEQGKQKQRLEDLPVPQLAAAVREEVIDRGRNWQNSVPQGAPGANSAVILRINAPFPAQLASDMLVYAFDTSQDLATMDDIQIHEGQIPLGQYLGIFRVTNVQEVAEGGAAGPEEAAPEPDAVPAEPVDGEEPAAEEAEEAPPEPIASAGYTMVTLQPNWRASGAELGRISAATGQNATWSLYEKMPVDNRFLFAELDEETIKKLFPAIVADEFVRDMQAAQDTDPPGQTFIEVKFLKEYTLPGVRTELYPHDADQPAQVMQAGDFAWLAEASSVTPDGTDIPGVQELLEAGIVTKVAGSEPRFERDLRDYDSLFQDSYLARIRLQEDIADITRKISQVRLTAQEAAALMAKFEDTNRRLQFDRDGYQRELDAINKHLSELSASYQQVLAELKAGFIENQQIASQIERIQLSAAAAINRRTREPATEATAQ